MAKTKIMENECTIKYPILAYIDPMLLTTMINFLFVSQISTDNQYSTSIYTNY